MVPEGRETHFRFGQGGREMRKGGRWLGFVLGNQGLGLSKAIGIGLASHPEKMLGRKVYRSFALLTD